MKKLTEYISEAQTIGDNDPILACTSFKNSFLDTKLANLIFYKKLKNLKPGDERWSGSSASTLLNVGPEMVQKMQEKYGWVVEDNRLYVFVAKIASLQEGQPIKLATYIYDEKENVWVSIDELKKAIKTL